MKKTFTMLLLLCSLCSVSFANEQEVVASFKAFVADLVTPVEATYGNGYYEVIDGSEGYFKTRNYVFTYTYDIKKSDSVMYPYIGILEVSNQIEYSKRYMYEIEARKATDIDFTSKQERRYIYKYDNGKWIGKVAYFEILGEWQTTDNFSLDVFKCKQN